MTRKGDAIVGEACSPTTTYAPQMFMLTQNPFVAPPVQKPRGPGHAQKPHEHHKEKCGHACTVDSDCGGECKCRKGDGSLHHTCKVPTTDTKKPKPDGRPDDQDPKHNCCHGGGECGYSWCAPKQKCVQKFLKRGVRGFRLRPSSGEEQLRASARGPCLSVTNLPSLLGNVHHDL